MGAKALGLIVIVGLVLIAALADDSKDGSSPATPQPKGWNCHTNPDGSKWCEPIYGRVQALENRFVGEAQPAVDLPEQLRQHNWRGDGGGGSCVHASTISLLRWLADGSGDPALDEIANTWPYSGGETSSRWRERVSSIGLKYVMTVDGDPELLNWAIATRRGCAIAANGHCRDLVGYDAATDQAIILDNNHPSYYDYQPWTSFVSEWQAGGGWAFAFVYDPPTPVPNTFSMW